MRKQREHRLAIGDRVIVRSGYRGRKCGQFAGCEEHVGRVVELADGRARVDCDGKMLSRNVGQVEYYPTEAEIREAAAMLKRAALERMAG